MRDILFRGKCSSTGDSANLGQMVTGFLSSEDEISWSRSLNDPCNVFPCDHVAKVDPKTVGQFTGLTDKNGTKIFEGDIFTHRDSYDEGTEVVEDYNDFIYSVIYSEDHSGLGGMTRKDIEVTGNIHNHETKTK